MKKRLVVAGIMLVSAMAVFAAGQKEKCNIGSGSLASSSGKPVITFMTTEILGNELKNRLPAKYVERYEAYTNTQVSGSGEADGEPMKRDGYHADGQGQ
jgi:ABC-type glycerol-3-phosphate transport system substrate-binding protein